MELTVDSKSGGMSPGKYTTGCNNFSSWAAKNPLIRIFNASLNPLPRSTLDKIKFAEKVLFASDALKLKKRPTYSC